MSIPLSSSQLRYLTIVGVVCCFGLRYSHGAAIGDRLRRSASSTATTDQCTLDYGIHLQLTTIQRDIERIFLLQYPSEGWEIPLVDTATCFPSVQSSSGYNGQWIAARLIQIRQLSPWYRQIEDTLERGMAALPSGFHPRFISLINIVNSTSDRLERRMNRLSNRSSCECPDGILDGEVVLVADCHVPDPPELLLADTFLTDISKIIKLIYLILHDLNARRVEHAIC